MSAADHSSPSPPARLDAARRGVPLRVLGVEGGDALQRRLVDHGLWPGVEVELITTALGGDPMLFRLQGYRLALRRDEAARVVVEPAAVAVDPGNGHDGPAVRAAGRSAAGAPGNEARDRV